MWPLCQLKSLVPAITRRWKGTLMAPRNILEQAGWRGVPHPLPPCWSKLPSDSPRQQKESEKGVAGRCLGRSELGK